MKAVKSRKTVGLCQFFVWLLLLVPHAWFSLRDKNFYETALYSIALVAGAFLAALPPSIWTGKQAEKPKRQDAHREETSP